MKGPASSLSLSSVTKLSPLRAPSPSAASGRRGSCAGPHELAQGEGGRARSRERRRPRDPDREGEIKAIQPSLEWLLIPGLDSTSGVTRAFAIGLGAFFLLLLLRAPGAEEPEVATAASDTSPADA